MVENKSKHTYILTVDNATLLCFSKDPLELLAFKSFLSDAEFDNSHILPNGAGIYFIKEVIK